VLKILFAKYWYATEAATGGLRSPECTLAFPKTTLAKMGEGCHGPRVDMDQEK